jgi:hypothetical protein
MGILASRLLPVLKLWRRQEVADWKKQKSKPFSRKLVMEKKNPATSAGPVTGCVPETK